MADDIEPDCTSHHEFMALYHAGWGYEEYGGSPCLVRPTDGARLKVPRQQVREAADLMIPRGYEKVDLGSDPAGWAPCLELWKPI